METADILKNTSLIIELKRQIKDELRNELADAFRTGWRDWKRTAFYDITSKLQGDLEKLVDDEEVIENLKNHAKGLQQKLDLIINNVHLAHRESDKSLQEVKRLASKARKDNISEYKLEIQRILKEEIDLPKFAEVQIRDCLDNAVRSASKSMCRKMTYQMEKSFKELKRSALDVSIAAIIEDQISEKLEG